MSKLIKDIVDVCLKEDLQKVLQKTTQLKEMSPFEREFARQMKIQGGPGAGKTFDWGKSKIALKYSTQPKTQTQAPKVAPVKPSAPVAPARPVARSLTARPPAAAPAPAAKVSAPLPPSRPATMTPPAAPKVSAPLPPVKPAAPSAAPAPTQTARDMMQSPIQSKFDRMATTDSANQTKATPPVSPKFGRNVPPSTAPAPPPTNMSAPPTRSYSLPTNKDTQDDAERAKGAVRGIRSLQAGNIDTKSFEYPGSASAAGRATEPPTKSNVAPEPAPKPEPETNADGSGARKLGIPVPTTPAKPDEPGYSDYMKGAERLRRDVGSRYVPESVNESFVNVGSNKYRIV